MDLMLIGSLVMGQFPYSVVISECFNADILLLGKASL
jgi:hypothetical protein